MRHQWLQIDQPSRNQTDRFGIDIMIPILELQVDLLGRHVHERDILEVLSDTNDEDSASEAGCLNGLVSVSWKKLLQRDIRDVHKYQHAHYSRHLYIPIQASPPAQAP